MILYREGLSSGYEIEMLSRMFFPVLTLAGERTPFPPPPQEDWLLVRAAPDGLSVVLSRGGTTLSERSPAVPMEEQELALARMLFRCAVKSGCVPLLGSPHRRQADQALSPDGRAGPGRCTAGRPDAGTISAG